MDIKDLDTLVFAGGGVRGLAYVGVLLAFEDTYKKSVHSHFTTFAGTSVGALFAMVCAINADIGKSLETFQSIGLEKLFDKDPTWLLSNYALNDGLALRGLVTMLLESRGFGPEVTLMDLFKRTGKTLTVTVVDILTSATLYLDHTNMGSMPVVTVLMGSMALPPMFPPVKHNDLLMMDGGLLDNFPIAKYVPERTLGLRTSWFMTPNSPTTDISAYYTRVLSILQLTMHSIQSSVASKYTHTIYIDVGPIKADDSGVNANDFVFKGYRAAVTRFALVDQPDSVFESPSKYLASGPVALPDYVVKLFKRKT